MGVSSSKLASLTLKAFGYDDFFVDNTIIYGLILSPSLFENRPCLYIIPYVTSCSLRSKKPLRYLLLPIKLSPIRLMNGCDERLICFAAKA